MKTQLALPGETTPALEVERMVPPAARRRSVPTSS
jgi:hypothetical protein